MLILDTPITIGSYTYGRMVGGIRLEIDQRTRTIVAYVSLAREKNGVTVIGTKEMDGDQARVIEPPIVRCITLRDSSPADPAFVGVFQKLHELTEAIEAVTVNSALLVKEVYLAGEEEVSLACTFVSSAAPGQLEEKVKKRKEEPEAPLPEPPLDPPPDPPAAPPPEETGDKKPKATP